MKEFLEDKQLNDMSVPTVTLTHHQVQLKHVLLSTMQQKQATKSRLTLKGVIVTMNKQKNILTGAGIAGALAIAVFAFSVITPPKSANAMEIARNASHALMNMTPEDQATEYNKYRPHFLDWLQQAQQAPDLRVLTYDQFIAAYPEAMEASPRSGEPLRVIDNPADGAMPNVHELRYLEFTVTDGDSKSKVVVGINAQNIPEAAMTSVVKMGAPRIGA